jgi:hypothetical protein
MMAAFPFTLRLTLLRLTSLPPIHTTLTEAPLAVIIASRILGYDATGLANLYLGSFFHFSLQILSISVILTINE